MKKDFFSTSKLPPYIFEAINQSKKKAREKGLDILDFGMGNPDMAPPKAARELLGKLVQDPSLYGYSDVGGVEELKQAHCHYYKNRFNVCLDPKKESIVTIGAKEGLTSLAVAISGGDDYIVTLDPSYPIHSFAFTIAKINVKRIEAKDAFEYLAKFKELVANADKKPTAILVNYPSNPTGEYVPLSFYEELVEFCRKEKIYIISDIAYCELYFDEKYKPNSILEVKGAKEVAIEFSTVSKTFCLAGTRVGFAAGNVDLIDALHKMKSYLDYGSFTPLQKTAAYCLENETGQYLDEMRAVYLKRAKFMLDLFAKELDWQCDMPKASMFIWAKMPEKFLEIGSFEFCKKLIEDYGVAFSPGAGFGKMGEGYVRISLIHDEENVRKAVVRLQKFIHQA